MSKTRAYVVYGATDELKPFVFEAEVVKLTEVAIDILYGGICHSDPHSVKNDWTSFTQAIYPREP